MAANSVNMRSKVNMLVQKKQIPEPRVAFTQLADASWHCGVEIEIAGKPQHSYAEGPTKGAAHEKALFAFDFPDAQPSKLTVPEGCWMFTAARDKVEITYTDPKGAIKLDTIKNTSNIFSAMQKIAKRD